jgi:proliferating cell nuclear antigen PCNA
MFSATLDDISLLRDSVATISELIDEGEFKVRSDGIELLASDRAVVAVVDFRFSAKNFSEYNYESDRSIGINLSSFLQVLRRAKGNEKMRMKLTDSTLELTFANGTRRHFTIPLLELREDVPAGIDKLAFPVNVSMSPDTLGDSIDDADLVSDSMVFEVDSDRMHMAARNDSSSAETHLEGMDNLKITAEKSVRARYSLDYLKKMIKAKKISDNVSLSMDSNYPLKMEFSCPDKVSITFILAPRIED